MKTYLFLILSLFVLTASAENWLNHSKIVSGSIEAYSIKSECERVSGEKCFDTGSYPSTVFSEISVEVDDTSKPNYSKNEIESCLTNIECDIIHGSKVCGNQDEYSVKNYQLSQVYCTKFLGYDQKIVQTITIDQVKLDSWQAQETVKASAALKEASIRLALKRIECGKRVVALLIVRNSTKNLSTAQISQVNTIYAPINGLIDTGSLLTAKEMMLAVTPDGVLITEDDKNDLVAEVTKCL